MEKVAGRVRSHIVRGVGQRPTLDQPEGLWQEQITIANVGRVKQNLAKPGGACLRSKSAYSGGTWALIPETLGRSFRSHLGADSGALGRLFRRTWAPGRGRGLHPVRVPDRAT